MFKTICIGFPVATLAVAVLGANSSEHFLAICGFAILAFCSIAIIYFQASAKRDQIFDAIRRDGSDDHGA